MEGWVKFTHEHTSSFQSASAPQLLMLCLMRFWKKKLTTKIGIAAPGRYLMLRLQNKCKHDELQIVTVCRDRAKTRKFLRFYSPKSARKVTWTFTEILKFWKGLCGGNADAVNRHDLQCVSIAVKKTTCPLVLINTMFPRCMLGKHTFVFCNPAHWSPRQDQSDSRLCSGALIFRIHCVRWRLDGSLLAIWTILDYGWVVFSIKSRFCGWGFMSLIIKR